MKTRDKIIAAVLVAGFIIGVVLIVTDLNSSDDNNADLQLQGTSAAEISERTGLFFSDDLAEFRSALSETGEQVDIRFVATAAEVEAFISESELPPLTKNQRLLTHSSPVWDLNPVGSPIDPSEVIDSSESQSEPMSESDLLGEFNPNANLGAATLHLYQSTSDIHDQLVRVVEVVDLEDGTFEVRIMVTTQQSNSSASDTSTGEDGD